MQTLINVVNNAVTVTNDSNQDLNRTYTYSQASFLSAKSITTKLLGEDCLKTSDADRIQAAYTKAGDMLGVSVSEYVRQIKGAAKRIYIDPINDLVKRFCLVRVKPMDAPMKWIRDPYRVDVVNTHKATIQEYIDDGNTHLAAYGMVLGNAYEAKSILGKGLWKKVCRTSRSRNDMIWAATQQSYAVAEHNGVAQVSRLKAMLAYYHTVPTTLMNSLRADDLMHGFFVSHTHGVDNLITKIVRFLGGHLCNIKSNHVRAQLDKVNDTATMRNGFSSKWSIKRMNDEHAAGIRDQMAKDFPKDLYNSVKYLTALYDHEGCTAELITSAFEMGVHGKEQGHCIGSYARRGTIGEYVVYKLTDESGTVSTLGINNPAANSYNTPQHYLAYNQHVSDEDVIALAEIVKADTLKAMKEYPEMLTAIPRPAQAANNWLQPDMAYVAIPDDNDIPF